MLRFNENNEVIQEQEYRAVLVGLELNKDISYSMQELAGLEVTGKVNSVTWDAISELYNAIASGNIVQPDQYPGYIID